MSEHCRSDNKRYVIIGAGMSGMLAGIKLLSQGNSNFSIYEKAEKIGGTWRENTYPGLTCDVPAHSYTYSFAPNPEWSRVLAGGDEIQAYFESVEKMYKLTPYIRFNEEIESCVYQDGKYVITSKNGTTDVADFVIAATGVLHHPNIPRIAGMDTFQGDIFHSARWDHSVALDNKRVAVIGTGSTGVQIVSALSKRSARVAHFQRSPQWIRIVENRAFTEEEKAAFRNNPKLLKDIQNDKELQENIEKFSQAITDPDSPAMLEIDQEVHENLSLIKDVSLREKVTPNYRPACKRIIYSPDFYDVIQRENVDVFVGGGFEVVPNGIKTEDGRVHEFDVIVLATGFQTDKFVRPINVVGENGISLDEVWNEGPTAYLAVAVPGFPNFFMLNGPSGPVGNFSLIEIAEHQWSYIEKLIERLNSAGKSNISVKTSAYQEFEAKRVKAAKNTIFATGCQSWYLDKNGVPATWPWTRSRFFEEMSAPNFENFTIA
ncbi:flavin-containing monooxygenase [Zhongshania aquimaris]|uniref:NAD(P)/FAD-dependent oxidoreductase n=1 Tax=Zhongshania aquimaris TaxID=2857107 RepID=A0ABS6VV46_9GAMM|nr:NAD(P)/FAD-dependent oxidoreductase [Zhongshania aquimaris]MBW2942198.1 NAD(P)/FAD-dependent oxidoreductase [Zhongshania aquimaris]